MDGVSIAIDEQDTVFWSAAVSEFPFDASFCNLVHSIRNLLASIRRQVS
jgi:hypothetical protein